MNIDFRRLFTIILPGTLIAFALIALLAKLWMGFATHEDPVVAAKFKVAKPTLEKILKENRKRFERYNGKRYKGIPEMTIFDNTQLSIDYILEVNKKDGAQQQKETQKQFQRLLCRNKKFYALYDLQLRLKEQSDDPLNIAVNISEFDSSGEKLLWKVSITPELCRKKAL
jgi:hypothetical protein